MTLSINALVIIILAVIVLFAGVGLYMGTFPGQGSQVSDQGKAGECCGEYFRQGGCQDDSDVSIDDISVGGENCGDLVPDPQKSCCGGMGNGGKESESCKSVGGGCSSDGECCSGLCDPNRGKCIGR